MKRLLFALVFAGATAIAAAGSFPVGDTTEPPASNPAPESTDDQTAYVLRHAWPSKYIGY